MNINWKARVKNIDFWLALVPAIFLLIQACAAPFGYQWDFAAANQQATAIINAAFGLLTILGVVNDPTTQSMSDSKQAMAYEEPRPKHAE